MDVPPSPCLDRQSHPACVALAGIGSVASSASGHASSLPNKLLVPTATHWVYGCRQRDRPAAALDTSSLSVQFVATSNARFWKLVLANASKSVALSILTPPTIKALSEVKDFEESVQIIGLPPPEARASQVIWLLSQLQCEIICQDTTLSVSTYHCGLGRPGLLFNAAHSLLCAAAAKRGHSVYLRSAMQYLSWFDPRMVRRPARKLCLRAAQPFEDRRLEHMFSMDVNAQEVVAADCREKDSG